MKGIIHIQIKMDNTNEINKLAIFLKIEYEKKNNNNYDFKLPITKMSGIVVSATIKVRDSYFGFEIYNPNVHTEDDDDIAFHQLYWKYFNSPKETRDIENYKMVVRYVFDFIPILTFDKFTGKLIEKKELIDLSSIFMCFENLPNIELNYGECPSCFDKTQKKTPCGHFLCVECWGNLEYYYCSNCKGKEACDDEKCGILPCPICRQDIHYRNN